MTSRQFNQDVSKAKREALNGPVFITDRGQFSHVLLTMESYQKLTNSQQSIVDLIAMPGVEEIDFEPARRTNPLYRPADLS